MRLRVRPLAPLRVRPRVRPPLAVRRRAASGAATIVATAAAALRSAALRPAAKRPVRLLVPLLVRPPVQLLAVQLRPAARRFAARGPATIVATAAAALRSAAPRLAAKRLAVRLRPAAPLVVAVSDQRLEGLGDSPLPPEQVEQLTPLQASRRPVFHKQAACLFSWAILSLIYRDIVFCGRAAWALSAPEGAGETTSSVTETTFGEKRPGGSVLRSTCGEGVRCGLE